MSDDLEPAAEADRPVHPQEPAEGARDVPRDDRDDPDAPGNFVDDETSDDVPEPNEPA
jgi:hypothetical protein